MAKKFAKLQRVDCNEPINWEYHAEFLWHLLSALLLALREQGRLSPMQHRHAEEKLRQRRMERARGKQEEA